MRSTSGPDRGVAAAFAAGLGALAREPLPPPIAHEAKRALLNVLALAAGAARNPGVDAILATARDIGGQPVAPVLGRAERVDAHFAALAAGFAAHVDDFDDTHLSTVIHPGAACMAVLIALAGTTRPTGDAALRAFAIGCEAQLRAGVAISPEHYDRGWHITGTCGVLGAAVTAGMLLGCDDAALARAIVLAATMTLGQREAFGTMTKAYHPGKAAANGILAARLALAGVAAPPDTIESRGGFAAALSTRFDPAQMLDAFGERWELAENTYKPYPCGIVAHPSIDAALALRARIDVTSIESLRAQCHPLVPELMGNRDPKDGLQARFSAIHGIAAAICDGRVGLPQYETARVLGDDVRAVRAKTTLVPDTAMPRDAATLEAHLVDGTVASEHVAHARGSLARPLTDDELLEKAAALMTPIAGDGASVHLASLVFELERAPDVDGLLRAACAAEGAHV